VKWQNKTRSFCFDIAECSLPYKKVVQMSEMAKQKHVFFAVSVFYINFAQNTAWLLPSNKQNTNED